MSCPFAQDDAAYVLGALSPAERLEFERHLGGCDDCTPRGPRARRHPRPARPGRRRACWSSPVVDEPVPDTLLPTLSREVRRARRRRTLVAAAGWPLPRSRCWSPVAVSQVGADDGSRPDAARPEHRRPSAVAAGARCTRSGDVPVRGQRDPGAGHLGHPARAHLHLRPRTRWSTELPPRGGLHAVRADPGRATSSRSAAGGRSAAGRCRSRPRPPRGARRSRRCRCGRPTAGWC